MKMRKTFRIISILLILVLTSGISLAAGSSYTNPDTGYIALVEDNAGLLSQEEIDSVMEKMKSVTEYAGAAFITISENPKSSATAYAEQRNYDLFHNSNGVLFLIDMQNRELMISTDGNAKNTITSTKAETITDNTYLYASKGNYAGCAEEVFTEVYQLLNGERIAEPMKYICNALLALILGLLICFEIASSKSGTNKSDKELLTAAAVTFAAGAVTTELLNSSKTYSPINTGGGNGGGFSGGGHSSGGGFSGSSGGHKF